MKAAKSGSMGSKVAKVAGIADKVSDVVKVAGGKVKQWTLGKLPKSIKGIFGKKKGYKKIEDAELAGGHSIERHGAQLTDVEMEQRILGTHPTMPQSRTAMKFDSPEVHQNAVDAAYDAYISEIDAHFASGGGYKEWEFDYGSKTGTGYTNTGTRSNPVSVPVTSTKVTIAMKPDGAGGYILDSAYPSYP
jgi:hypothetical protein